MNNHTIIKNEVRATFTIGRWTIKVVPASEGYRTTDLSHLDADSIVKFYDNSTAGVAGFPPEGQFTCGSYYLRNTLLEKPYRGGGLCLHGGVPEWTVSPEDYAKIDRILRALV
jgi:hypothetical protein